MERERERRIHSKSVASIHVEAMRSFGRGPPSSNFLRRGRRLTSCTVSSFGLPKPCTARRCRYNHGRCSDRSRNLHVRVRIACHWLVADFLSWEPECKLLPQTDKCGIKVDASRLLRFPAAAAINVTSKQRRARRHGDPLRDSLNISSLSSRQVQRRIDTMWPE